MMRSQDGQARTVNTIGVESVDEVVAKVTAADGQVVMPKMAIPGICWHAYCSAPRGTLFGLHQEDPEVSRQRRISSGARAGDSVRPPRPSRGEPEPWPGL